MRKLVLRNLWWMTLLLALALLVIHSLPGQKVVVDSTSVVLVLVIFISPLLSAIRRIKFGEFEAEIDPKEIRRIKDEVESQLADTPPHPRTLPEAQIESTVTDIRELAESDPVIALAKLRIEVEKVISKLYRRTQPQKRSLSPTSLARMVQTLTNQELLPSNISSPIREVIMICNRAVHGELIRERDANAILDVGTSLLEQLFSLSREYVLKPAESHTISSVEVEDYNRARYRLTTVIPYVENPVRNVRIVDQEELDAFLEGYHEYAEFIVDITKEENDVKQVDPPGKQ